MELSEVRSEVVAPVRLGVRTLGLIVAETGHAGTSQERALLQQVAKLLARHFTTAPGKLLLRHTREKARAQAEQKHKPPQSERAVARKAAAGEQTPR
jgi:predicted alpha/beta-hydrolase family hydrolase